MQQFDFVENYLRAIFGFCGLTDITFFNAQPMDVSLDLRYEAQKRAIHDVREFVANSGWGRTREDGVDVPFPVGIKPAPIEEPALA